MGIRADLNAGVQGSGPGSGDVTGPGSSTNNDVAVFNGATGKIIKDSGVLYTDLVIGPASVTSGDVVQFNGTTGKLISDGSKLVSNLVTGPASVTDANIAVYNGTTGKIIKDGGSTIASIQAGASVNSTNGFRLTLSSGNPVYRPLPATPSSTDTTAETTTFAAAHGWTNGTMVTTSATAGGLTIALTYFIHVVSSTTVSYHTTLAGALAGTSPVNLTGNVTGQIIPSGVQNTTVYFEPYISDQIALFDGSSTWNTRNTAGANIAISVGTLTANLPYDVFVYDNATVVTVDTLVAWTSTTARATALVRQNGVWVKSGATTRRYVGTFYTNATTSTIDDGGGITSQQGGIRGVYNAQNRISNWIQAWDGANSFNYSTATWQPFNNNTGNAISWMDGLGESLINADYDGSINQNNAGAGGWVGIGLDNVTNGAPEGTPAAAIEVVPTLTSGVFAYHTNLRRTNGAGYHTATMLQRGTGTATTTWIGKDVTNNRITLMQGHIDS